MSNFINLIENNGLSAIAKGASQGIVNAIGKASASTGVDFAYLLQQAKVESSFDAAAKATTSSATGLYQFINSTWMSMVENYGEKYGIDTANTSKDALLELRNDPEMASNMAAEFASENQRFLNTHWAQGEKEIGSTELYLAHFLGAPKAAAFLNAMDESPVQSAAVMFPSAASANRSIFYDTATGREKSLSEVYARFDQKFEVKDSVSLDTTMVASNDGSSTDNTTDTDNALYDALNYQATLYNQANSVILGTNTTASKGSFYSPLPSYQMIQSPVELMLMSQMDINASDALFARDENNNRDRNERS